MRNTKSRRFEAVAAKQNLCERLTLPAAVVSICGRTRIPSRATTTVRTAIIVDGDNVNQTGGRGMQYDVLQSMYRSAGSVVSSCTAFFTIDPELPTRSKARFHDRLRGLGVRVEKRHVHKFVDGAGVEHRKGYSDVELAVAAFAQADLVDRIVLVTADRDFVPLVTALRQRGIRVEVIAFANPSRDLRLAADRFASGFDIPDLVRPQPTSAAA